MLKIFFGFDIWKSYAESSWNPQKKNIEIQNIIHWDQGNAFHEKTPRKSKFSVDADYRELAYCTRQRWYDSTNNFDNSWQVGEFVNAKLLHDHDDMQKCFHA